MKKNNILYPFVILIIFSLFSACGENNKAQQQALQQAKQARQDSLERARQMRQQRMDSLAAARADSIAAAKAESKKEKSQSIFNPQQAAVNQNGHYSVQVGAWRSKDKAQRLAETWQSRGFENAYVAKYGVVETGNIWFRVRLGKYFTRQEAHKLQTWLTQNYQTHSWVAYVN